MAAATAVCRTRGLGTRDSVSVVNAPVVRVRHHLFPSDFGHADEFVGVVHSVIRRSRRRSVSSTSPTASPSSTHEPAVSPARGQLPQPGIVIAVDPGVGTDRRPVAEVGDGMSAVLIGPDNGLLAPAVGLVGGATRFTSPTRTTTATLWGSDLRWA